MKSPDQCPYKWKTLGNTDFWGAPRLTSTQKTTHEDETVHMKVCFFPTDHIVRVEPGFFSQNSLKTQVYVDITMRAAKDILGLVGFCFRVIPCVWGLTFLIWCWFFTVPVWSEKSRLQDFKILVPLYEMKLYIFPDLSLPRASEVFW